MKRNIVFIGSMASGKSHIGRNLAADLGWQFVDTDRYLEKQYRMSIAEIYEKLGEKGFRNAEREVLKKVCLYHEAVISVGGNFPMPVRTIHFLQRYSYVIALRASERRIVLRVKRRIGKRPTMNYNDVPGFVHNMMGVWKSVYKKCDYILDTTYGNSDVLIKVVKNELKKRNISFKKRVKQLGGVSNETDRDSN